MAITKAKWWKKERWHYVTYAVYGVYRNFAPNAQWLTSQIRSCIVHLMSNDNLIFIDT